MLRGAGHVGSIDVWVVLAFEKPRSAGELDAFILDVRMPPGLA